MITGFKESKIFVKHISYDYRRTCDTGKCNPNKKWSKINVHVNVKNHWNNMYVKEIVYEVLAYLLVNIYWKCCK